MASYSTVSKLAVKQTSTLAVKDRETDNEFIEQVEKLFQQIHLLSTNPTYNNDRLSLEVNLLELRLICSNMIEKNCNYDPSNIFDTFYLILKNYIRLLDIDQFVNIIIHDISMEENNKLLRSLFEVLNCYNIYTLTSNITIKVRREIFFCLLNQITTSTRISSYLQNNLLTTSNNDNINKRLIDICELMLYIVLHISYNLKLKLTNNDLEKYQNNLFTPLIMFIDEYFIKKENLRVHETQSDLLIIKILYFIWNIADNTLTIPIFLNASCPQLCLRWLSLIYLNIDEYECIIHILYHIARHDEGAIILNKSDFVNIANKFKDEILNKKIGFIIDKDKRLNISRTLDLALILIIDPDDDIKNNTINQLLSICQSAVKSPKFQYKGHHISIPLIILMKLCTNDNIIDYILLQDQCPILFFTTLKILLYIVENNNLDNDDIELDILAIIALANIFWSISFHDQYKNTLIQNINLIKQLEIFRENETINYILLHIHIPHQMSSLRRTIDGIWHNLYLTQSLKTEIKSIERKSIYSIMICYSHINIKFSQQLYDILNKLPELTINVDFINLKYLLKEILEIIEQSDLILILISKDFFYSKSCRQQFIYINDILKKPFIPIFINNNYQATGWLYKRISKLKSIHFNEINFINIYNELILLINEKLSINISSSKNLLNIKQWNNEEVKQWFIKNNIISELYDFYQFNNGNELLLYAQAILSFPWTKEYERIKLRFNEKFKQQEKQLSPLEFSKFIRALEYLKIQNINST